MTVILTVSLIPCRISAAESSGKFSYKHDPAFNQSAMRDIVADENAVYGFRPSDTGSLKMYASADWSDPAIVEQGRLDRIEYHKSLESMYGMLKEMKAEGKSTEEIARALSTRRNEIRLEAYADDPEGLAAVKARNLEKYGHEEGPLPDELYEQYGSWEKVTEKAFSPNSGMDACLGLYDDYYFLYVALGEVEDSVTVSLPLSLRCSYRGTVSLEPDIETESGFFTVSFVSDNPETASVDENGKITGLKYGDTAVRCIITDINGNETESAPCRIQVRYTLFQWIIMIFMLGCLWY